MAVYSGTPRAKFAQAEYPVERLSPSNDGAICTIQVPPEPPNLLGQSFELLGSSWTITAVQEADTPTYSRLTLSIKHCKQS